MAEAERCIEVAAAPEALFAVITDYEAYSEFLPEIESATLLSRRDGHARVRFVLNIVKRITYTLDLEETAPTSVRWTMKDGDLRKNSGSWAVEEAPRGSRATYKVEVEVGMFVPGAIVSRLVGETLPATLEAFAQRALTRGEST
ncbi:MAG: SRPBCC family protein [Deltaproteobacteria bacterium]|nr:SRPBCC family protein [Deltaproteobacteria bacterium]